MVTKDEPSEQLVRKAVWTVPNALSFLRLLSVPVFLYLFISGRETAAVVLYAIGAWSDFFDGVIARRLNQVSELGKLLDPLADRIFISALVIALVARDALPLWLAIVVVGRDLLLLSLFPVVERRGIERIHVNFVGKSGTAALLFGLTWLAAGFVWEFIGRAVGLGLVYVGAALYWLAASLYAREAWRRMKVLAERVDA
jgi:cardiolipin synthase (CMP-forming)